jgi:hypothetical protein
MNSAEFAMSEFVRKGWVTDGVWKDGMQEILCTDVIKMLSILDGRDHSGSSAGYIIKLFEHLAHYKALPD